MPPHFPCPNPACTQVFAPADVRGATSLTCPRCGTVFQFRAGAAKPKAAAPSPLTKPRPAVPLATPVRDERPIVEPPDDAPIVKRPARRRPARSRSSGRLLVLGVVFAVLLGGAAATYFLLREQVRAVLDDPSLVDSSPAVKSPTANFRFRLPGGSWEQVRDVEHQFGVNLALRRTEPNAWLALLYRDYKDRMPRDDEVLGAATARLRAYFPVLEWEQRDEDVLGGRPAQRIIFQGESKSVPVSGECVMTAHGGIAYWFFTWTPSGGDLAAAQEEWAALRQGFALLKERDGWSGKVPELVEVRGTKDNYALHCPKDIWSPLDPTDKADVVLLGRDPDDPKTALKTATVTVLVRPAAADLDEALKEARALAEKRQQEEGFRETKTEVVPATSRGGLPEGDVDLGKARARVTRLRVANGEERERFLAIAVVPRPGKTLFFLCESAWAHRAAWEERFGPLLHSLTFEKR